MCKYQKTVLADLIEVIGGGTPKTKIPEYWNGDIPWLSVKDFNNDNRYVYSTEKTITEDGLKNSSTKMLKKDDIILSARGTVGELAMLSRPMAFNQSCYGIRGRKEKINQVFLFYLLKNSIRKLKAITHGSVFDTITRDTFENIEVYVPDMEIQEKIASFLSTLDDKIELNKKINDNLEKQACALFQEIIINNSASLEPNGILSDIADITMGQSPKGSTYNEEKNGSIFFQGRAEFGNRFPNIRLYTTGPKRMAKKGDVLMSVRAPVGDLNIAHEDCCIGRGLASIHAKNDYTSFVFYTMKFLRKELDVFNGQGTVFGSINGNDLKRLPVLIPPIEAIKTFERLASSIDNAILSNSDEIYCLVNLREKLLTKLLNGKISL